MPIFPRNVYGDQHRQLGEDKYVRLHIYASLVAANADVVTSTARLIYVASEGRVYFGTPGAWNLLGSGGGGGGSGPAVTDPSQLPTATNLGSGTIVAYDNVTGTFTFLPGEVPVALAPGDLFTVTGGSLAGTFIVDSTDAPNNQVLVDPTGLQPAVAPYGTATFLTGGPAPGALAVVSDDNTTGGGPRIYLYDSASNTWITEDNADPRVVLVNGSRVFTGRPSIAQAVTGGVADEDILGADEIAALIAAHDGDPSAHASQGWQTASDVASAISVHNTTPGVHAGEGWQTAGDVAAAISAHNGDAGANSAAFAAHNADALAHPGLLAAHNTDPIAHGNLPARVAALEAATGGNTIQASDRVLRTGYVSASRFDVVVGSSLGSATEYRTYDASVQPIGMALESSVVGAFGYDGLSLTYVGSGEFTLPTAIDGMYPTGTLIQFANSTANGVYTVEGRSSGSMTIAPAPVVAPGAFTTDIRPVSVGAVVLSGSIESYSGQTVYAGLEVLEADVNANTLLVPAGLSILPGYEITLTATASGNSGSYVVESYDAITGSLALEGSFGTPFAPVLSTMSSATVVLDTGDAFTVEAGARLTVSGAAGYNGVYRVEAVDLDGVTLAISPPLPSTTPTSGGTLSAENPVPALPGVSVPSVAELLGATTVDITLVPDTVEFGVAIPGGVVPGDQVFISASSLGNGGLWPITVVNATSVEVGSGVLPSAEVGATASIVRNYVSPVGTANIARPNTNTAITEGTVYYADPVTLGDISTSQSSIRVGVSESDAILVVGIVPSPTASSVAYDNTDDGATILSDRNVFTTVNSTTAAFGLNLPAGLEGDVLIIKDAGGAAGFNNVTISGAVDGGTSVVLNQNFQSITLRKLSTQWGVI